MIHKQMQQLQIFEWSAYLELNNNAQKIFLINLKIMNL